MTKKYNTRHVELAQRILDIVNAQGLQIGERLVEQTLATHCQVSRTPIRKALQILAEKNILTADEDGGYLLGVDAATLPRIADDREGGNHPYDVILSDLGAGRLDAAQSVASIQRRYGCSRQDAQNALLRLAEEHLAERGAGQQWLLKTFAADAEALAKGFEFRLVMEPLVLTMPGFQLDHARLSALKQAMVLLRQQDEFSFDLKLFERTDFDFHMALAQACGNPFMTEALCNHHRRRRIVAPVASVNVYRLQQSNQEHIQIIDQIERGNLELAADLMRVHIQLSNNPRPLLAGRGVPAAFQARR